MAMNEDSVVSSLNELRQMASDRARRETETRARQEPNSPWDDPGPQRAELRPREVRPTYAGNGYQNVQLPQQGGHSPTLMGGHAVAGAYSQAQPAQPAYAGGYGYGYSHQAQPAPIPEPYQEPIKQKSAVGPVMLTILLLGGAAGGGYWKLQQDFAATLHARDMALLQAEEGRNKAIEAASRAEQLAKVSIAAAEQKTKVAVEQAAAAARSAPEAAPAAAAPAPKQAVAAKSSKAEKNSRRGRRAAAAAKKSARVEKAPVVVAAPPPPAEEKKPPAMPKIAGKKVLKDDPLAGLKL
jgi:hypothetical protein